MMAKYGNSDHAEKNQDMVCEIFGSKVVESALYRDGIVEDINLAPMAVARIFNQGGPKYLRK